MRRRKSQKVAILARVVIFSPTNCHFISATQRTPPRPHTTGTRTSTRHSHICIWNVCMSYSYVSQVDADADADMKTVVRDMNSHNYNGKHIRSYIYVYIRNWCMLRISVSAVGFSLYMSNYFSWLSNCCHLARVQQPPLALLMLLVNCFSYGYF